MFVSHAYSADCVLSADKLSIFSYASQPSFFSFSPLMFRGFFFEKGKTDTWLLETSVRTQRGGGGAGEMRAQSGWRGRAEEVARTFLE